LHSISNEKGIRYIITLSKKVEHTQPFILQPEIIDKESQPYKLMFADVHMLAWSDHTIKEAAIVAGHERHSKQSGP